MCVLLFHQLEGRLRRYAALGLIIGRCFTIVQAGIREPWLALPKRR